MVAGFRRPWVLAIALMALVVATQASASQLGVSGKLTNFALAPCTSATMSVHVSPTGATFAGNKSAVQITNYPASCNGKTVKIAVANAGGTLLTSGTGTCTGSPCVITTGSYDSLVAAKTSVLIQTWGVPASWDSTCSTVFFFFLNCT